MDQIYCKNIDPTNQLQHMTTRLFGNIFTKVGHKKPCTLKRTKQNQKELTRNQKESERTKKSQKEPKRTKENQKDPKSTKKTPKEPKQP